MPFYGNRKYHHSSLDMNKPHPCAICGKPFIYYWKDAEELNGFSEQLSQRGKDWLHFYCTGAKSLHQLNAERKLLSK